MKKNYLINLAFALFIFLNFAAKAQNWTVGVPVDMQVSYLTKYSGFCAPGQPDFKINVVCNQIDGIEYIIIIDSLVDIAVIPFPLDTVELGDTLFLNTGNNIFTFSFVNGPGNISFNIKAIGTPTTAGQTYPCAFSDLWSSNLLLCNEELVLILQNDCSVDASIGINQLDENNASIQFPNLSNQYQLQVSNLKAADIISICDITGKQIKVKPTINSSTLSIPCHDLNSGIYFITLSQNNISSTHKFVIHK